MLFGVLQNNLLNGKKASDDLWTSSRAWNNFTTKKTNPGAKTNLKLFQELDCLQKLMIKKQNMLCCLRVGIHKLKSFDSLIYATFRAKLPVDTDLPTQVPRMAGEQHSLWMPEGESNFPVALGDLHTTGIHFNRSTP